MRIIDISQEILSCKVFKGDPKPKLEILQSVDRGDTYNLSALYMCNHNGTHIDAPYHFINDGDTVERIPLEKTVGYAYVAHFDGILGRADAEDILKAAVEANPESAKRILIKGNAVVSLEAARRFAQNGIYLLGNQSQTVGPEDAPMAVHKVLLEQKTVLLEGLRLDDLPQGVCFLCAQPLSIKGAEGAPCRAIAVIDVTERSNLPE